MTRFDRIVNCIFGILQIAFAIVLMVSPGRGLILVLAAISIGLTLTGVQTLIYYLDMARSMVGGKSVLYRGLIFLDLGILTRSLIDDPRIYLIAYIGLLTVITGMVGVFRTYDLIRRGAVHWRLTAAYGITHVIMGIAVLVFGFFLRLPVMAVFAYALMLFYSACIRIAAVFKENKMIYIQ